MATTMSQDKGLVVGVVGLGVGEQHAMAYVNSPSVSQVLLCDLDIRKSVAIASRLAKCSVATSFDSIINDFSVDVVSIASFDDIHYSQVIAALAAGKHVFVEKPLCRTFDELIQIKSLLTLAGGKLQLGCNLVLRTAQLYSWLRQAVARGEFGEIYAFDGDYLYGRLSKITEGWRSKVVDYSVMKGGGIHLIDLMLWISGQRPINVTAAGNRICSNISDFKYNDFSAATLQFESGMIGRITANYGCVHRHHHALRIFGTQRTFIYDDAGARMHCSRDPSLESVPIPLSPLPFFKGELITEFIEAVLCKSGSSYDVNGVFEGISVAIACDRASASGENVKVEYV